MFNPFVFPMQPQVRPMTGQSTMSPMELFLMMQQQGAMPMGPETIDAQRMGNFRGMRPTQFAPGLGSPMRPTPFMPTNFQSPEPQFQPPMPPSVSQFMPPQAPVPPQMAQQPDQVMPQTGVTASPIRGSDPMKMALLAAGLGMLSGSGPSTQQRSFGQILGHGGMQGLNMFAHQRHQQFQENQLLEAADLRREEITDRKLTRQGLADEYKAKQEERQRNLDWQKRYEEAGPEEKNQMLRDRYTKETYEAQLKEPSERNPWSGITVSDYTKESVGAYQKSIEAGKPDRSVLVADPRQTRQAGATTIDARAFDRSAGTERAKTAQQMQKDALKAVTHANTIEMLADSLEGYSGGPFAEFQGKIGRLFPESEYGKIASIDDVTQAVIGKSYSQVRAEGTGATSDFEAKGFIKAFPSLAKTPQGRQFIKTFGRRVAERETIASDIYAELADKGTVKLRDWLARVDKEAGPYFTKEEWKQIRALESGMVPRSGPKPWERKW